MRANPIQHIYVAGHLGMVGSAIVRRLQKKSDANIITRICPSGGNDRITGVNMPQRGIRV